jgi:nicotinate-nucleotide adenylyltransferase
MGNTADQTEPKLRVGIFGGTFNPVHLGHVRMAREAARAFSLDTVLMVPSSSPPHKPETDIVDARERLAMLLLAVADMPKVAVSDIELHRAGPSYSVDTVTGIQNMLPADARLYFILGQDAFVEIDTWKSYPTLFEKIALVVLRRTPTAEAASAATERVATLIRERISAAYAFDMESNAFIHSRLKSIFLLNNDFYDISSTDIRARIRRNENIAGLVPDAVGQYIAHRGLYR